MAPKGSHTNACRQITVFITIALVILITIITIFNRKLNVALSKIQINCPSSSSSNGPVFTATEQDQDPTLFREIPLLEDMTHENDEAWHDRVFPGTQGFLHVMYNETFAAPWGISMFHGLHCLGMLREELQIARGMPGGKPMKHESTHGKYSAQAHEDHVGHCFSYLAQSLFCAADDTIEPPVLTKDDAGDIINIAVDGQNFIHQCRDYRPTWQMALDSYKKPIKAFEWAVGDTIHGKQNEFLKGRN
ncbi:hypothetical protein MMC25_004079 [Agyrium rufum]|nr:hypothetical protein [Agyrium rufum]